MARHLFFGWVLLASISSAPSVTSAEPESERNVTAFTPGTVISVGQDIVVGVISRGTTSGDGVIKNVVLDLEAISPSLQSVMGGKSARVVINADCPSRRIATQSMQIFERPNATGAAKTKGVVTDWTTAPTGSYGADVLDLYCKPAVLAALTTTPKASVDSDPKPALARPSSTATAETSNKSPSHAIAPVQTKSAAAKAPVMLMTAVVAPTASSQPPELRTGGYGVQLLSSLSAHEAQESLVRLKSKYAFWPAGRDGFVSRADVAGASRFRAKLGGFTRFQEAKAFCEKVTAAGGQCMVVKDPS